MEAVHDQERIMNTVPTRQQNMSVVHLERKIRHLQRPGRSFVLPFSLLSRRAYEAEGLNAVRSNRHAELLIVKSEGQHLLACLDPLRSVWKRTASGFEGLTKVVGEGA